MRPAVTLWIVVAAILLTTCSRRPDPRAKHLVLITVDTLRADRLGCYGRQSRRTPPAPSSPHIDKLAENGVRFVDAYANRGMTLPSMTSFFTSKYPLEHGVLSNLKQVQDDELLLAERLRDAGFHNFCVNAQPVLGPERGNIEQGFEKSDYRMFADEREMIRFVERYVDRRFGRDDQREFLWIHFMNPHKPYAPPAPFDTMHTDPFYTGPMDGSPAWTDRIFAEQIDLSRADREHIEDIYDGTVSFVDTGVEIIRRALEQRGLLQDTLFVFTADHGEDLYSHNHYYYHANSVYRSTTHIPMIFHQPGRIPPGQVVDGIVESVDFMPTALNWLGLDKDPAKGAADTRLRGADLTDVLLGKTKPTKELSVALIDVPAEHSTTGKDELIFCTRNAEWSYVWNRAGVMPRSPPEEGRYPIQEQELYHVAVDPDEQVNLINDMRHAKVADFLFKTTQSWLDGIRKRTLEDTRDPAVLRMLEEQGYVGAGKDSRPKHDRGEAGPAGEGGR